MKIKNRKKKKEKIEKRKIKIFFLSFEKYFFHFGHFLENTYADYKNKLLPYMIITVNISEIFCDDKVKKYLQNTYA